MIHENLNYYYASNFALKEYHNYSLSEIDNMIPFEKRIYTQLIINKEKQIADDRRALGI
jgi:hypothetical protein